MGSVAPPQDLSMASDSALNDLGYSSDPSLLTPRKSGRLRRSLARQQTAVTDKVARPAASLVKRGINRVQHARIKRRFHLDDEDEIIGDHGFGVVAKGGHRAMIWITTASMVIECKDSHSAGAAAAIAPNGDMDGVVKGMKVRDKVGGGVKKIMGLKRKRSYRGMRGNEETDGGETDGSVGSYMSSERGYESSDAVGVLNGTSDVVGIIGKVVKWTDIGRIVKMEQGWKIMAGESVEEIVILFVEREHEWIQVVEERLSQWQPQREEVFERFDAGRMQGYRSENDADNEIDTTVDSASTKSADGDTSTVTLPSVASEPPMLPKGSSITPSPEKKQKDADKAVPEDVCESSDDASAMHESDTEESMASDVEPQEMSVPGVEHIVWKTNADPVDRPFGLEYKNRKEQARSTMDAPPKFAFNLFFIKDSSDYHKRSNHTNVKISDWRRGPKGYMTRDVSFVKQLGYRMGPKETRVEEKHRYSFKSNGGVLVEVEGHNLDVPFGTKFQVESFFELNPVRGKEDQTQVVASVGVHFFKKGWLNGKIESGTLEQTKTAFARNLAAMKKAASEQYKKAQAKQSPRGRPCSLKRRTSGQKPPKYPRAERKVQATVESGEDSEDNDTHESHEVSNGKIGSSIEAVEPSSIHDTSDDYQPMTDWKPQENGVAPAAMNSELESEKYGRVISKDEGVPFWATLSLGVMFIAILVIIALLLRMQHQIASIRLLLEEKR